MVSKKHNRTKNVGKNRTKNDRTLNHTRKIVDRSRKRRKTMRGGINQNEYISVEFFKNRLDKNIGRIIRVVQDPIFGNKTNDIADMSYLFGKRMGEIDEVIDIMKHGRKKKPYKRILYRLRFNDTHGPVMSYSQKPIKQCGGPSAATTPGPPVAKTPGHSAATTPAAKTPGPSDVLLSNYNVDTSTKPAKKKESSDDATVRTSLNRFLKEYNIENDKITDDLIRTTSIAHAISYIDANQKDIINQFNSYYKQFSESQDKPAQELNGIMGCMTEAINNIITTGTYLPAKRALFEFIYEQAIAPKMAVLHTKYTKRTEKGYFAPSNFRTFLEKVRPKPTDGCMA